MSYLNLDKYQLSNIGNVFLDGKLRILSGWTDKLLRFEDPNCSGGEETVYYIRATPPQLGKISHNDLGDYSALFQMELSRPDYFLHFRFIFPELENVIKYFPTHISQDDASVFLQDAFLQMLNGLIVFAKDNDEARFEVFPPTYMYPNLIDCLILDDFSEQKSGWWMWKRKPQLHTFR